MESGGGGGAAAGSLRIDCLVVVGIVQLLGDVRREGHVPEGEEVGGGDVGKLNGALAGIGDGEDGAGVLPYSYRGSYGECFAWADDAFPSMRS